MIDGQAMANRAEGRLQMPAPAFDCWQGMELKARVESQTLASLATLPSQHLYVEMNWSCQSSPIEASENQTSRLPTCCAWFPNIILKECDENGHLGVSENSVPLNPMVLLIIIPFLNGYFIGNINPTFSDQPTFLTFQWLGLQRELISLSLTEGEKCHISHLRFTASFIHELSFFWTNMPTFLWWDMYHVRTVISWPALFRWMLMTCWTKWQSKEEKKLFTDSNRSLCDSNLQKNKVQPS